MTPEEEQMVIAQDLVTELGDKVRSLKTCRIVDVTKVHSAIIDLNIAKSQLVQKQTNFEKSAEVHRMR
jgi:hypothetical protein